jgi:thymidylate synthase
MMFQCHVHPAREEGGPRGLSLQLYQRSCDIGLGVPFNIASYAALTMMIAQVCGMEAREFIHDFGDFHIYVNHIDALTEQLTREPYPMPELTLNPHVKELWDFTYEDIGLHHYKSHPAIFMEVAV